MIKLKRPDKPIELTDEVKERLTNEFKDTGKSVWREKYIVDALNHMSNNKCCFCETKLNIEGKAMQVEHFHHKAKYPDEVVEWDNLLPSCGRCNTNKGTHDTKEEPIINPTIQEPKEYLYLKNYTVKSKNKCKLGLDTIRVLYLNDSTGLVQARFRICEAVRCKIEDIEELLSTCGQSQEIPTRRKNKIVNGIKDILRCAQPSEEYSAVVANAIIKDETYQDIKKKLIELGFWDSELEELEKVSIEIMFDSE